MQRAHERTLGQIFDRPQLPTASLRHIDLPERTIKSRGFFNAKAQSRKGARILKGLPTSLGITVW